MVARVATAIANPMGTSMAMTALECLRHHHQPHEEQGAAVAWTLPHRLVCTTQLTTLVEEAEASGLSSSLRPSHRSLLRSHSHSSSRCTQLCVRVIAGLLSSGMVLWYAVAAR